MKRFLPALAIFCAAESMANANYPELMVAPKASERLSLEGSRTERDWSMYLPLQVAAVTTLTGGILAHSDNNDKRDPDAFGPKVAIAVGASWLAASVYFQQRYRPYSDGVHRLRRMSKKTSQEQLAAERVAEEQIDSAARLARKIKWLSFGSNLVASAWAANSATGDTTGRGIAMLGVATSILPVIFPMRYEQVSEDHRTYKKRVLGPISMNNAVLIDPASGRPALGIMAGATF